MVSARTHFSDLLHSLPATVPDEQIDLASLAKLLGTRSTGALLLFFALPMVLPIPAPGISVLFGMPLILISGQILFGRKTFWLPLRFANRTISKAQLEAYVARAVPPLRGLEKVIKPRLAGLTQDIPLRLAGAMCMILALIIALPVPFGHFVPGIAIAAIALGLIERDGLMIIGGFLIGGLALLIIVFVMMGLAVASNSFFGA